MNFIQVNNEHFDKLFFICSNHILLTIVISFIIGFVICLILALKVLDVYYN
jgi:hypothetical protein